MTIQNTIVKNISIGNGSTTQWPYTFACPEDHPEYIKVYITDADGAITQTTAFSVNMTTKLVTYPLSGDPLTADEKITIARELPLYQLLNLVNQGAFYAEDLEVTYDEIVMMVQQINEKLSRAFTVSLDIVANTIDLTLPMQAGYGWRVSDDGTKIEAMKNPETVLAECEVVKDETESIKNTAEAYKDTAGESAAIASTSAVEASSAADLAKAWAQSSDSPDGTNNKSSKSWAAIAESNATAAATSATYCKAMAAEGYVYDYTKTYEPGEACMTSEGNLWRCVAESTGEIPSTSSKWVSVSVVNTNTFEPDENGDLMPLIYPKQSGQFDIDDNGDIEPAE